jgi:hypothetical protein
MESSSPSRVLIVAHQTATTQALLDAVRERAARGAASFTLVVPAAVHGLQRLDPEDPGNDDVVAAQAVVEHAVPLLAQAAAPAPVDGIVGSPVPLTAVMDAINQRGFDEVIVSTLPHHLSRWLRLDLPHKIGGLGLPVTTVTARSGAPEGAVPAA